MQCDNLFIASEIDNNGEFLHRGPYSVIEHSVHGSKLAENDSHLFLPIRQVGILGVKAVEHLVGVFNHLHTPSREPHGVGEGDEVHERVHLRGDTLEGVEVDPSVSQIPHCQPEALLLLLRWDLSREKLVESSSGIEESDALLTNLEKLFEKKL